MKVVQTTLTEAEHKLLKEYAKRNQKSIKEVVREAIRTTVEGNVNPNDPIFTSPPSSRQPEKETLALKNTTSTCTVRILDIRRYKRLVCH